MRAAVLQATAALAGRAAWAGLPQGQPEGAVLPAACLVAHPGALGGWLVQLQGAMVQAAGAIRRAPEVPAALPVRQWLAKAVQAVVVALA